MLYRDEVIIVKSRDLGETDKIFMVFGKRRGKFSFVSKGVRRAESKKCGHLQTFNVCRISCATGKSLDILTEVDSISALDSKLLTTDEFERLGFLSIVLDKFLPEDVPEPYVFDMVTQYLSGSLDEENTRFLLVGIIQTLGFGDEKQEKLSYDKLVLFVNKVLDRA
ncbi:MAG: DNA repair protein RecO [bacterium]